MKKLLRLVSSAALLSSLALTQLPSPATCQMVSGYLMAKVCAMPCCTPLRQGYGGLPTEALAKAGKKNVPMPNCPMIKAQAPRDLIATSDFTWNTVLQPLHLVSISVRQGPQSVFTHILGFTHAVRSLFASPQVAVRAPPSDIHLQEA